MASTLEERETISTELSTDLVEFEYVKNVKIMQRKI
jgi:hypothetical protein